MKKLKRFLNVINSYFPSKLPTGMEEQELWAKSIIEMSNVPDNDSTRFALAVMVLHIESSTDSKPKLYFVRSMNKGAANEIANAVAMDLKEKQKKQAEANKAAEELRKAETLGIGGADGKEVLPDQKVS